MKAGEIKLSIAIAVSIVIVIYGLCDMAWKYFGKKEQPTLVQPPNYDKKSLLELMEKGECVGGTIDEGKFSVFVCKE